MEFLGNSVLEKKKSMLIVNHGGYVLRQNENASFNSETNQHYLYLLLIKSWLIC